MRDPNLIKMEDILVSNMNVDELQTRQYAMRQSDVLSTQKNLIVFLLNEFHKWLNLNDSHGCLKDLNQLKQAKKSSTKQGRLEVGQMQELLRINRGAKIKLLNFLQSQAPLSVIFSSKIESDHSLSYLDSIPILIEELNKQNPFEIFYSRSQNSFYDNLLSQPNYEIPQSQQVRQRRKSRMSFADGAQLEQMAKMLRRVANFFLSIFDKYCSKNKELCRTAELLKNVKGKKISKQKRFELGDLRRLLNIHEKSQHQEISSISDFKCRFVDFLRYDIQSKITTYNKIALNRSFYLAMIPIMISESESKHAFEGFLQKENIEKILRELKSLGYDPLQIQM